MNRNLRELSAQIGEYRQTNGEGILLREQEPMALHTTFRIGGPADLYLEPKSEKEFQFLLRTAKQTDVRTYVIGRGSNLLFSDEGFRGAVISLSSMKSICIENEIVRADAGASLNTATKAALDASLTGMEFAHGIPGSVGGAVFMNAGAYDGEIAQILVSSRYYDRNTDTFEEIPAEDHAFGYRESIYRKHPERVIVSASFRLSSGDRNNIREKMEELIRRRVEKQPLEYPSAGSTFKRYPGRYTAQMIDEAGLKGYTIGGAQISEKHAGFIINRGGASAADVLSLIGHIRKTLKEIHGIDIETEVIYVPAE